MAQPATYVIGHANPDTDSISSAIAYAALRHALGDVNVIPARQGNVRPETAYVLERFGFPQPMVLRDAYLRVAEVMSTPVESMNSASSIMDVSTLLRRRDVLAVPLTDDDGVLVGVVAMGDLGRFVFEGLDPAVSDSIPIELHNVLKALDGTVLHAATHRKLRDKVTVGAMSVESIRGRVQQDALLVLGNREDAQVAAIEGGIGALIITGGFPVTPRVLELAVAYDVTVVSVEHHTFSTVRLLHMSIPVSYVMNRDPQTCSPDDRVATVRPHILNYRMLPVVDDHGRPVGIISRSDLLKDVRKKLVLVDHNERGQSLPGIEESDVVAIVDHHRIADVVTSAPILFRAEPVGCTCTIIAGLYEEAGISIPETIAGMMLAAIVNDTVLFQSPTCTARDRDVAARLEAISGVQAQELAKEMFARGSTLVGRSARDLVEVDFKEYSIGKVKFGVSALEVTNFAGIDARIGEVKDAMEQLRSDRNYVSLLLVVVDVISAHSRLYAVGEEEIVLGALGGKVEPEDYVAAERVISRKKDIVPRLTRIAQAIDQR